MKDPAFFPQAAPTLPDDSLQVRVWQRVSPTLDPFPELSPLSPAPLPAASPSLPASPPSPPLLERLLGAELTGSRLCLSLARRVRDRSAQQALCRMAREKQSSARQLAAACFLRTGEHPAVPPQKEAPAKKSPEDDLRTCYLRELHSAALCRENRESIQDSCLRHLLAELSEQALARAGTFRTILEKILPGG